jgi:hypothetical protein
MQHARRLLQVVLGRELSSIGLPQSETVPVDSGVVKGRPENAKAGAPLECVGFRVTQGEGLAQLEV